MVDDSLILVVSRSAEVLNGQVSDRYVSCLLGEGVKILVLTVEDRARSSDERITVRRDDLAVLAGTESMLTWREPVGRIRHPGPVVPANDATLTACPAEHCPLA